MIRLNEAQYRKVKKLTRRLCANNDDGCCLVLDDGDPCVCVQAISYSLLCRYFREAVLPADRELCADIMREHDTRKKCEMCGKNIKFGRICPACAKNKVSRMKGYLVDEVGEEPVPDRIVKAGRMYTRKSKS